MKHTKQSSCPTNPKAAQMLYNDNFTLVSLFCVTWSTVKSANHFTGNTLFHVSIISTSNPCNFQEVSWKELCNLVLIVGK